MQNLFDPISLAQELIKKQSITPMDDGALDLLQNELEKLGFVCKRYVFEDVDNLYARFGKAMPNFCFAGHTDVVPIGDEAAWKFAPFAAIINDGKLYGRGAADMKSAIAAFVFAAKRYIENGAFGGSISFLITGDEEGVAINGTKKLLAAITNDGEEISHCIVGEPTCPNILGDMIKNGRRGSLNCHVIANGTQGHVGYPDKALNPIPLLVRFLDKIKNHKLDDGAAGFQASNLEIVTIDVGNKASNVIPQSASAKFNIRFNTNHTGAALSDWLMKIAQETMREFKGELVLNIAISGEPFFTTPCEFTTIIQNAAHKITNIVPELSTTGGTSDARFIKNYCPVCEFGLVGETIHKVDEHTSTQDILKLCDIYYEILIAYFQTFGGNQNDKT